MFHLPVFDGFIICGKQKQCTICWLTPSDFVDFLLYFQTLEIVKLKEIEDRDCFASLATEIFISE